MFSTGDWQDGRVRPKQSRNLSSPAAVERGDQTRQMDNFAAVIVHALSLSSEAWVLWRLHCGLFSSSLYSLSEGDGGRGGVESLLVFFFSALAHFEALDPPSCLPFGDHRVTEEVIARPKQPGCSSFDNPFILIGPIPCHILARECRDGVQHRGGAWEGGERGSVERGGGGLGRVCWWLSDRER